MVDGSKINLSYSKTANRNKISKPAGTTGSRIEQVCPLERPDWFPVSLVWDAQTGMKTQGFQRDSGD